MYTLAQPDDDARDSNDGGEIGGEFFETGGDTAELLEAGEQVFNEVAGLVFVTIKCARRFAVGTGWNHGFGATRDNVIDQSIGVIALIGGDGASAWGVLQEGFGLGDVRFVGGRDREAERVAERVRDAMDFAAQAAPRASQSLWAVFFLAPAACRWARTAVLSKKTCSRSASVRKCESSRAHTPFCAQREKRTCVLCQLPNSGGRSRHGAPVRPIHSTASTKRRLSWAVTPRSETLPGSKCSIRCHCASLNNKRAMVSASHRTDTLFIPNWSVVQPLIVYRA